MAELFDLEDLPSKLQVPEVDSASAELAAEWAEGQLEDVTGLTAWPDPVPKKLKHWALDLAVIAYNNPTLVTDEQVDDYRVSYEDRQRIESILARARSVYNTAGQPQYSFPEPDWSWTTTTTTTLTD
jgi:hypothetical protein